MTEEPRNAGKQARRGNPQPCILDVPESRRTASLFLFDYVVCLSLEEGCAVGTRAMRGSARAAPTFSIFPLSPRSHASVYIYIYIFRSGKATNICGRVTAANEVVCRRDSFRLFVVLSLSLLCALLLPTDARLRTPKECWAVSSRAICEYLSFVFRVCVLAVADSSRRMSHYLRRGNFGVLRMASRSEVPTSPASSPPGATGTRAAPIGSRCVPLRGTATWSVVSFLPFVLDIP